MICASENKIATQRAHSSKMEGGGGGGGGVTQSLVERKDKGAKGEDGKRG